MMLSGLPNLPKRLTALGFCLAVVFALVFGSSPVLATLGGSNERYLIPYVLGFVGVLVVLVVGCVLYVTFFGNPTRLNLREASAADFIDIDKYLGLGDSQHPVIDVGPRDRLAPPERGEPDDLPELEQGGD